MKYLLIDSHLKSRLMLKIEVREREKKNSLHYYMEIMIIVKQTKNHYI